MTLSQEALDHLRAIAEIPQPPDITIAEFRATLALVAPPRPEVPGIAMTEHSIRGGSGQPLALRVYRPTSAAGLPVLVWAHGGSFVRGHLDDFDSARAGIASACECVVAAVDQRLAPESFFPAPIDDVVAAFTWTRQHASEIGGDPARVGLAGESSGGNLATAACLRLAGRSTTPSVLLLLVPLLDATFSSASFDDHGHGFGLDRPQLEWAIGHYAPGHDRRDPLVSPLLAPDLTVFPPTLVVTAEHDPLRDDGERFAARLRAAGRHVMHRQVDGAIHHVLGNAGAAAIVVDARQLLACTSQETRT